MKYNKDCSFNQKTKQNLNAIVLKLALLNRFERIYLHRPDTRGSCQKLNILFHFLRLSTTTIQGKKSQPKTTSGTDTLEL